jgi:hypothetical protein
MFAVSVERIELLTTRPTCRRGSLAVLIAAMVPVVVGLATASNALAKDTNDEKTDFGPGCAPDRPAIAHHAGGVSVENGRGRADTAPIPCTTNTGFRTAEISIVVSNDGTVLFQPALALGLHAT